LQNEQDDSDNEGEELQFPSPCAKCKLLGSCKYCDIFVGYVRLYSAIISKAERIELADLLDLDLPNLHKIYTKITP